MLLETTVAALIPVMSEGIKQIMVKFIGGPKPTSIAEVIQLGNHEIDKLKALAALDNPGGTPSQWVINLRGSSRYIAAIAVIGVGITMPFVSGVEPTVAAISLEAANIAFGFLFGTRIVAGWKK